MERVGEPGHLGAEVDALTPGERALYVLMTAVELVGSGGFEQFFYERPELALAAATSAKLVKARKFMAIFEQANAIAFVEPPRKRAVSEFRRMLKAVESSADELARLDTELDALMANSATRIEALLLRYIQGAPQEFADV
ncbi:uncharacterized protein DUF4375 [Solirubrobacter pauli]|uniref:Uncharacterized protein DUF4375 n=1 Tax=Solirubrobacter pauli TaxID=166793 RepID=A0A660L5S4_9ACTN|nr:uncharacterized protein DUF4375 [Solirubrobacter pauli]